MSALLRLITLRHLMGEPTRTFLTLLGVALGVSVYLAIRLANESVLSSFSTSIDLVSGKTTLQIQGSSLGFDEEIIRDIRREPGVIHAAPVIETSVGLKEFPGETLSVLGIDPLVEKEFRTYSLQKEHEAADLFQTLLDPSAILLTRPFCERLGIRMNDTLTLLHNQKKLPVVVKGILNPEGPAKAEGGYLAFMDISASQWIFGKIGRLDRIDLVTDPDRPVESLKVRLQQTLPLSLTVQRPKSRTRQVEEILYSFQLNLSITGGIALLVALFLVHNTMTIAVAKRRKEIGLLRSLGVTQGQVIFLMVLEGMVLGAAGSILGTGMGLFLARWTLRAVSMTVSSLYLPIRGETLALSTPLLLEGLLIGIGISFLSVLGPALEAAGTVPRETLQAGYFERRKKNSPLPRTVMGIIFILLSGLLSFLKPWGPLPLNGYLAAFFLLLGGILWIPMTTLLLHRFLASKRAANGLYTLAINNLTASLQRTTSAATPLLVALALMVGILVMVHSFRKTVDHWIGETIRADLIVMSSTWDLQGSSAGLPSAYVKPLSELPGVLAADGYREVTTPLNGIPTVIVARDLDIHHRFSRYLFIEGPAEELLPSAARGNGVLLSEPLSLKRNLSRGDELKLETPQGSYSLPVLGVFYDYATDGGKVLMDTSLYRRLWPSDQEVNVVALYLEPQTDPSEILTAMKNHPWLSSLDTLPNRELRKGILEVFDQTFSITYALELIAVIVGVLGIFNTLLTSILERKRELGILRAIGMNRKQLVRMILYEGGFIGLIGGALGGLAGIGLSWLLIGVINKEAFGWTIQFFPFPPLLGWVFVMVFLTAILASVLPAQRAVRIQVAEAVHYE